MCILVYLGFILMSLFLSDLYRGLQGLYGEVFWCRDGWMGMGSIIGIQKKGIGIHSPKNHQYCVNISREGQDYLDE